ncbi:serine protease [Mangrovicella endophytica]|uniref:serine protease n=1 Tax=Mangrovicella endophytica TaxID=2066697 RepID=UPI000C9DC986|nr:serine protease [Mangrovicella endophytica]
MRRAVHALVASLVLSAVPAAFSAPVQAASALSDAYNSQTDAAFRKGLQMRLAWTGDYAGAFDGDIGAGSLRAIRDFQARHGLTADGVISEPLLRQLVEESDRIQSQLGLMNVADATTGVTLPLPLALVRDLGRTSVGRVWRSADESIEIETVRLADGNKTLSGLYAALSTATPDRSVTAAEFGGSWFTVAGEEKGRAYFIRFQDRGDELRGFSASYAAAQAERMKPYVAVASNLVDPFAGEPEDALVASNQNGRSLRELISAARRSPEGTRYAMAYSDPANPHLFELPQEPAARSQPSDHDRRAEIGNGPSDTSGTGFVVSRDGWILTNAHVAGACKTILVGDLGASDRRIIDKANDLALIHVEAKLAEPLPISATKPRLGEDILALGFPLRSILADSLNVTRGNVSSLMGLMNDPNYLQISAPVQPGNSGGPLIDLAGRVVGVVTAKLNAVAVADVTGDIPQSINFAIRTDAATKFLTENGIEFETADAGAALESVPDATAKVKDAVLPVLCLGNE